MTEDSDGSNFNETQFRRQMIGVFGTFEKFHSCISSNTTSSFGISSLHGVVPLFQQMPTTPNLLSQRGESRCASPTTLHMLQSMQNLVDRSPLHPPTFSRKEVYSTEPSSSRVSDNDENVKKSSKRRHRDRTRESGNSSERERKRVNNRETDDDTETSRDSVSMRLLVQKRDDMHSLFGDEPESNSKDPPDKGTPDSGVLSAENGVDDSLSTQLILSRLTNVSPMLTPPRFFNRTTETMMEKPLNECISPPRNRPSDFFAEREKTRQEQERKEAAETERIAREVEEERKRKAEEMAERERRKREKEQEELERAEKDRRRREKEEREEKERLDELERRRKEKDEREKREKEERDRREREDAERREREEMEKKEKEERLQREKEEKERIEKEKKDREEAEMREKEEKERKERVRKEKEERRQLEKEKTERARLKEEELKKLSLSSEKPKKKREKEIEKENKPVLRVSVSLLSPSLSGSLDLSTLSSEVIQRLRTVRGDKEEEETLSPQALLEKELFGSSTSLVSSPARRNGESAAAPSNGVMDMDIADSSDEKEMMDKQKEDEEKERRRKEKEKKKRKAEKEKERELEREREKERLKEKEKKKEKKEKEKDNKEKTSTKTVVREPTSSTPVPAVKSSSKPENVKAVDENAKLAKEKNREKFREAMSGSPIPKVKSLASSQTPSTSTSPTPSQNPKVKLLNGTSSSSSRVPSRTSSPLPAFIPPPSTNSGGFCCASGECAPSTVVRLESPPITDGKPAGTEFYQKRAKDVKHQADQETDKVLRLLLYFDCVVYFIRSVAGSGNNPQSSKLYSVVKDTNELLKFVTSNFLKSKSLTPLHNHFKGRLRELSFRTQAILMYHMYQLRSNQAVKQMKVIEQLDKQVEEVKKEEKKDGKGTGTVHSVNTPSPAGSSNSGSGGGQQDRVLMPSALYVLQKQQLKTLSNLMWAHKLWDDARQGSTQLEKDYLERLESVCGRLSVDCGLESLTSFILTAVEWMRSEFTMEKLRPPPPAPPRDSAGGGGGEGQGSGRPS